MATTAPQLLDIDDVLAQQNGPLTKLYKVAAPFTTIVNRAQVTDLSKDLLPRFGINRVCIEAIQEVQGETGPNGERVFKAINDIHDQVRFVGPWAFDNATNGQRVFDGGTNAGIYVEITFYGTGLNLLTYFNGTAPGIVSVTVDGTLVNSNLFNTTGSGVLTNRNYSQNTVLAVASGLALGLHTVQIKTTTYSGSLGLTLYGFEILNSAWQNPPGVSYNGGKKLSKPALTTDSYNSNFETGTLGTKGGHAVVYQKADGSVAKAVNPVDVSALYLTAATHTNEDVIRTYAFREFGAGRSDDFSYNSGTGQNVAFTLDDGTTTLVGSALNFSGVANGIDAVVPNGVGSFITLTFVGTGLDIVVSASSASPDSHTVVVDGTSVGAITSLPGANAYYTLKIASGLPYGTHTVKITRTVSAVASLAFAKLITYGTKKPSIPTGSVEIADYYLMANYVATTTGDPAVAPISTGVLAKTTLRELIYTGTGWSIGSLAPTHTFGLFTFTSTNGDAFAYTFFGTGIELGVNVVTAYNLNVKIDGVNYTGAATISPSSAGTWTPGTSSWTANGTGNGTLLQISGLSLGVHTVLVTRTSGTGNSSPEYVAVITPVHSPKSNQPGDLQNTLLVGSQAVGDSRKLALQSVKALSNWSQAVGVSSNPTTTSNTLVPVPDMTCIIKTSGNPIDISYSISVAQGTAGSGVATQVFVDGIAVGTIKQFTGPSANYQVELSDRMIVPVSAGVHVVQLFWITASATTSTAYQTYRTLTVTEKA